MLMIFLCCCFCSCVFVADNTNIANKQTNNHQQSNTNNTKTTDLPPTTTTTSDWSNSEVSLLRVLMHLLCNNYCAISRIIASKTCQQVIQYNTIQEYYYSGINAVEFRGHSKRLIIKTNVKN